MTETKTNRMTPPPTLTPTVSCILFSAFLVLSVGCGQSDGKLKISGKVTKAGTPFTVPDDEYVRVTFFPVTSDGGPPKNTYAANYNGNDASFQAIGGDGHGIPPGKYRVAVEHEKKGGDAFKGKYDGDRSPFEFEIDQTTKPLVIDLDSPKKQ
jgi:hypothetical protein